MVDVHAVPLPVEPLQQLLQKPPVKALYCGTIACECVRVRVCVCVCVCVCDTDSLPAHSRASTTCTQQQRRCVGAIQEQHALEHTERA